MEHGFVAALTSATFAVVSGGIAALTVTGIIRAKLPLLYEYRVSKALAPARPVEPLPRPHVAGRAAEEPVE
jgi:hypothetical protein